MSPQASLAEAEAARRREERKQAEAAGPVQEKLSRIEAEDDVARLFRHAFGGR